MIRKSKTVGAIEAGRFKRKLKNISSYNRQPGSAVWIMAEIVPGRSPSILNERGPA